LGTAADVIFVGAAAQPLDSSAQSRLEKALKSSAAAQQAKSVRFEHRSRPELIGGIVVDFGDKSIDLSVQSRVQRLNSLLQRMFHPILTTNNKLTRSCSFLQSRFEGV
jgi:F-type H+-transporting ATPase subunit O